MELIDPDLDLLTEPLLLFFNLNSAALFILGLVGELTGLLAIFVLLLLSQRNFSLLLLSSFVNVLLLTIGGLLLATGLGFLLLLFLCKFSLATAARLRLFRWRLVVRKVSLSWAVLRLALILSRNT